MKTWLKGTSIISSRGRHSLKIGDDDPWLPIINLLLPHWHLFLFCTHPMTTFLNNLWLYSCRQSLNDRHPFVTTFRQFCATFWSKIASKFVFGGKIITVESPFWSSYWRTHSFWRKISHRKKKKKKKKPLVSSCCPNIPVNSKGKYSPRHVLHLRCESNW